MCPAGNGFGVRVEHARCLLRSALGYAPVEGRKGSRMVNPMGSSRTEMTLLISSQAGLKQSELCAPALINYWMWATSGGGGSLKLRQSLKKLTSERRLLTAYGANPSLKSVWVLHRSNGHHGRQGLLL